MNEKVFRGLFAAGAIAILALSLPLILLAVQAGIGLIGLGVIVVVGFGLIQSLPLIGQKLENFILKARKSEAAKNPIEQLQNFLAEKARQVEQFRKAVIQIGTQIASLRGSVAARKRERPGYDFSVQESQIQKMEQAHQSMTAKYKNAEASLGELKIAIQDKEFEWKFSQAGQAALASLNASSGEELMQQMLADTAFASVSDNFNKVFAELDIEAQRLTDSKQLTFGQDMVIDVSSINLSKVKV